jgi:Skp family chaperone for outer membrane proteins
MRERFKQYQKNAQKMQKKSKESEAKYQEADDIEPNIQSPNQMVRDWG